MGWFEGIGDVLSVRERKSLWSWLIALFLLPLRPVPPPEDKPALPPGLALKDFVLHWLARELGVRHISSRREWLLRLFVLPAPAVRVRSVQAVKKTAPRVKKPPRLIPALRHAVITLAHWLIVPEWMGKRLSVFGDALLQHPRVSYWMLHYSPARLIPVLEKALAWVHMLEDEALILAFLVTLGVLMLVATTPLTPFGQLFFSFLIVAAGIYLGRMETSFASTALTMLSMLALMRYLWWRLDATLSYEEAAEMMVTVLMMTAELYFIFWWMVSAFSRSSGLAYRPPKNADSLPLAIVMLAPVVFLLFNLRPFIIAPPATLLYLTPGLLLSLIATARQSGVKRGWRKWLQQRAAALDIPFPFLVVVLNLLALGAALLAYIRLKGNADTLFYAGWTCMNIWLIRAGGRLRVLHLQSSGQRS